MYLGTKYPPQKHKQYIFEFGGPEKYKWIFCLKFRALKKKILCLTFSDIFRWLVCPKELRLHGYICYNIYYWYESGTFDYWQ